LNTKKRTTRNLVNYFLQLMYKIPFALSIETNSILVFFENCIFILGEKRSITILISSINYPIFMTEIWLYRSCR